MLTIYLSSASAWLVVVLIGATIAIPYIVRPTMLSRWLGLTHAWRGSSLRRMRVHMWLGCGIIALVAFHAAAAMNVTDLSRIDKTGLMLATLAFASVIAQLLLGVQLVRANAPERPTYRRWHFWIMVSLVASALGHTVLNSPSMRSFVQ